MSSNNKIIWTITDGSQGMISQTNGLAQHLSKNFLEQTIDVIFPWSIIQPGFLPIFRWIFKNKFNLSLKPDVIISCGRKSIYASLFLKKIFNKKIITIHIQNPKINSKNFDYIIAPNHDNYFGNNILNTCGAIHKFTKKIIHAGDDNNEIPKKENLVSIIVGGPSRHYEFSNKIIFNLIEKISFFKKKFANFSFYVIPSRRTDEKFIKLLSNNLQDIALVWNKKTANPYLSALKYSKYFIVTSDSTSMISECAATGKPVYVYHLPYKRKSKRILKFHRELEEKNITKKLLNRLEKWSYEPLNEAERIAGILRSRI